MTSHVSTACAWALRGLLAVVFLWAGGAKLADPAAFVDGMRAFRLFPEVAVNVLAMIVPVVEVVAGLLIVLPRVYRVGALLACAMSFCFVGLFVWVGWQGISVSCSCFGAWGEVTTPQTGVVRGAALALMAGAVYVHGVRQALKRTGV